jgi:hypothetical protein
MGQAIVYALKLELGSAWDDDLQVAWVEVYDQLSGEIMKAILNNL